MPKLRKQHNNNNNYKPIYGRLRNPSKAKPTTAGRQRNPSKAFTTKQHDKHDLIDKEFASIAKSFDESFDDSSEESLGDHDNTVIGSESYDYDE